MPPRDNARVALRPEDEKLSIPRTLAYGLQHILTMYAGVIAPPLIIGAAAGLSAAETGVLVSAALLISGLATMLQTLGIWRFGVRLPLVQGASFVAVGAMTAIVNNQGLTAAFGSIIVASAIGFAIAPYFSRLVRFFPPVVTGSVITMIGVSLLPVAFGWIASTETESASQVSGQNLFLAGATLVVILALSRLFQGIISRLSILLGLLVGTLVAVAIGAADFGSVPDGPVVALPQPFMFGLPTFSVAAIVSMTIVILVIMVEATADILAVGEIVGTETDNRRVADGLRADMAASAVSPVLNSFPCSAFAQNVGLVALSRVKSRYVVAAGGGMLFLLGLFPVLGRVAAAIPQPVLGGAGVVLFGTVAASGIRTLGKVDFDNNLNLIIVATSLAFGLVPIAAPEFYSGFPTWVQTIMHSGISATAIVAVLLNLFFNVLRRGRAESPSVVAGAPAPAAVEPDGQDTETGVDRV